MGIVCSLGMLTIARLLNVKDEKKRLRLVGSGQAWNEGSSKLKVYLFWSLQNRGKWLDDLQVIQRSVQ